MRHNAIGYDQQEQARLERFERENFKFWTCISEASGKVNFVSSQATKVLRVPRESFDLRRNIL